MLVRAFFGVTAAIRGTISVRIKFILPTYRKRVKICCCRLPASAQCVTWQAGLHNAPRGRHSNI